jgi:hypothetical protein
MPLDENGCTDNDDLKRWYHHVFEDQNIQDDLLECNSRSDFSDKLMELSQKNGYKFSREILSETFRKQGSSWSDEELEENGVEDKWARKIMIMGWVPIGYSR